MNVISHIFHDVASVFWVSTITFSYHYYFLVTTYSLRLVQKKGQYVLWNHSLTGAFSGNAWVLEQVESAAAVNVCFWRLIEVPNLRQSTSSNKQNLVYYRYTSYRLHSVQPDHCCDDWHEDTKPVVFEQHLGSWFNLISSLSKRHTPGGVSFVILLYYSGQQCYLQVGTFAFNLMIRLHTLRVVVHELYTSQYTLLFGTARSRLSQGSGICSTISIQTPSGKYSHTINLWLTIPHKQMVYSNTRCGCGNMSKQLDVCPERLESDSFDVAR